MKDLDVWKKYLLNKAWALYIKDWDFAVYKAACESCSSTENINEFEDCEFYDRTVMKDLLTPEEIKIWEIVTGR